MGASAATRSRCCSSSRADRRERRDSISASLACTGKTRLSVVYLPAGVEAAGVDGRPGPDVHHESAVLPVCQSSAANSKVVHDCPCDMAYSCSVVVHTGSQQYMQVGESQGVSLSPPWPWSAPGRSLS